MLPVSLPKELSKLQTAVPTDRPSVTEHQFPLCDFLARTETATDDSPARQVMIVCERQQLGKKIDVSQAASSDAIQKPESNRPEGAFEAPSGASVMCCTHVPDCRMRNGMSPADVHQCGLIGGTLVPSGKVIGVPGNDLHMFSAALQSRSRSESSSAHSRHALPAFSQSSSCVGGGGGGGGHTVGQSRGTQTHIVVSTKRHPTLISTGCG